jgi:hypothetical protein
MTAFTSETEKQRFCFDQIDWLSREQIVDKVTPEFGDKPLCILAVRIRNDKDTPYTKDTFKQRCISTVKHLRDAHSGGEVHAVLAPEGAYNNAVTFLFGVYGRC